MKILLTTDAYFPMINGVALSTKNLYMQLKAMGHDVRIMTPSYDGRERFENDIYYLKSFRVGKIYPGARAKVPFAGETVKKILKWHPDIIHSQTEFTTMVTAKTIRNKLKIPQIHTYHTLYEDYLNYFLGGYIIRKGAAEKLTRMLLNTFDGVVAPTEKVKQVLNSYRVNSPIYVVPTGIELDKFHKNITESFKKDFYNKNCISDSDMVLGYIGRIAKEKNIREIIDYVKNIKNKNIKLIIVGGGPYADELKKEAASVSDRIIFIGMVKPDEVYKYYKLCHAFVTASKSETQGLTYIEALASGCPVICRDDKAVSKLIENGVNGYKYRTQEEFIKVAESICNEKSLYKKMSANAELSSRIYSTKEFALNILSIYEDALTMVQSA